MIIMSVVFVCETESGMHVCLHIKWICVSHAGVDEYLRLVCVL